MPERHLTRTAVFVVLEKANKMFCLRRQNTGWADGNLTIPSGHVDKGDSVLQAAIKETKEEAGVDVAPNDLEFIHVDYVIDEYTDFFFKATKWTGEPVVGEPHLASEGIWVDKDALPKDLIPRVRNMLESVRKGFFFSETKALDERAQMFAHESHQTL